jgi:tetratricopeptide (TPR) repeat protein
MTDVSAPADTAGLGTSSAGSDSLNDAETFVSRDIDKQLGNVDDSGKVIDEKQKIAAVRDTWITARKSFYQRRYELSEQSYQDVIKNTRDNHDAYGELGNVYFNQGKNKQAAAAYYEAAAILVKKGQVNRARSLVGLLRHLDEPKADELQQLIESVTS